MNIKSNKRTITKFMSSLSKQYCVLCLHKASKMLNNLPDSLYMNPNVGSVFLSNTQKEIVSERQGVRERERERDSERERERNGG